MVSHHSQKWESILSPENRKETSSRNRHVCLITCLRTRAVYSEVSYTISVNSLLMISQRFVAGGGKLIYAHSDNGSNFVGKQNDL